MQWILLWSMNKTSDYLEACDDMKKTQLVKNAMKKRRDIVKLYQEKRTIIKQTRLRTKAERIKEKEEKDRALLSQTISTTENVMKTCGSICKSD